MVNHLPSSPFLYPILDSAFSEDLVHDALDVIEAGAKIFQLRAKDLSKRKLCEIVQELSAVCLERNVVMIVNDFVDVVTVTGAAGVHLGQQDFPVLKARRLLPRKMIGISTHTIEQVTVAEALPVDYIAIGPIYNTSTKKDAAPSVGPSCLKKVRAQTQRPLICIGGIRVDDFQQLLAAGADGIALVSELYRAPGVHENIRRLLLEIDASGPQSRSEKDRHGE